MQNKPRRGGFYTRPPIVDAINNMNYRMLPCYFAGGYKASQNFSTSNFGDTAKPAHTDIIKT